MKSLKILAASAATLIAGAGAFHAQAAAPDQARETQYETITWMASLSAADGEGSGEAMFTLVQSPVPVWRLTIGVTDTTPSMHLPVSIDGYDVGMLATDENGNGTATFAGTDALPGMQDGATIQVGRLVGQFFSR
jgi:hypothetical protein